MSDFLATLAARIRPTTPPIEPRRNSIFELPAREAVTSEIAVENISAPPAKPVSTAPPTVSTEAPRQQAARFQQLQVPAHVPAQPTLAPQMLPVSTPPPPALPTPAPLHEQVLAKKLTETPNTKNEISSRQIQSPLPPPNSSVTHLVTTEKIVSVPAPPSPTAPTHREPNTAQPSSRNEPLLASPVVRLIEPAAHATAQPTHESASAEPPVIRVTIGRVEVRAVVPPTLQQTQPSTPKKSNPVISLDDYLKQQSSRSARV